MDQIITNCDLGYTEWTMRDYLANLYREIIAQSERCIAALNDSAQTEEKAKPQYIADDSEYIARRLKEILKEKENGVSVVPPSPSAPTIQSIY